MFKLLSYYITAIVLLLMSQANAVLPPYPFATSNQQLIAEQLQTIIDPDASQTLLLNIINEKDAADTKKFLNLISGAQYTSLFASTEITNRQFIRRLFDPLRPQISNPCSFEDDVYDICSADGIIAWAEGSVGRSFLNGNKNVGGFKMSGYDVSGGAQKRLSPTWTLGVGLCYAINHVNYNIGGSTKSNTVLGAAYTLYRPRNWYFLTNLTFGSATNDTHKFFSVSRTAKIKKIGEKNKAEREEEITKNLAYYIKSRPNIGQLSMYSEIGFDWICNCMLVQPFVGIEADWFKRSCKFDHSNLTSVRLVYSKKEIKNAYSRLGVHLTTPENNYDISCALDVAWQYRLTPARNDLKVKFAEFGEQFNLTGIPDERHSFDVAFTAWSEFMEGWTVYLQMSGERWKRLATYSFTGGLIFKW
jgi:uncharacterized protein with beta-barrel porin domain